MDEREILIESITGIKEHLLDQENSLIRTGLYMALQTIKNGIYDEDLLKVLGLDEDLEKYL